MKTTTALYFFLVCLGLNMTFAQEERKSESTWSWEVNNKKENKKVKIKGDVSISDDNKRITGLSEAASIYYSSSKDKLEVDRDRNGHIQYRINGEIKTTFNSSEESFLVSAIRDLINHGVDAKARARRIYAKNGINGLMEELKTFENDYPKSLYLGSILGINIPTSETTILLTQSIANLKSDYYKSETLNKISDKSLQNDQIMDSYLQAVTSIKSDYYQFTCLNRLINEMPISKAHQTKAIQVAQEIKSDYYQAELLKNIFAKQSPNEAGYQETLKLLASMKSDYYKAEVLSKLVKADLNIAEWKTIIAQVGTIKSAYYQAEVLQKIIAQAPRNESLKQELTEAAKGIKSETYYGKTMRKIVEL